MRNYITIRQETHRDYKDIVSLILRSFNEGTDHSHGTDVIALAEEIREKEGGHSTAKDSEIVMLAPVAVHADYLWQGIGTAMLTMGIE